MPYVKMQNDLSEISGHIIQDFRGYLEDLHVAGDVRGGEVCNLSLAPFHSDGRVMQNVVSSLVYPVEVLKGWPDVVPCCLIKKLDFKKALKPTQCIVYPNTREEGVRGREGHLRIVAKNDMSAEFYPSEHGDETTQSAMEGVDSFTGFFGCQLSGGRGSVDEAGAVIRHV